MSTDGEVAPRRTGWVEIHPFFWGVCNGELKSSTGVVHHNLGDYDKLHVWLLQINIFWDNHMIILPFEQVTYHKSSAKGPFSIVIMLNNQRGTSF